MGYQEASFLRLAYIMCPLDADSTAAAASSLLLSSVICNKTGPGTKREQTRQITILMAHVQLPARVSTCTDMKRQAWFVKQANNKQLEQDDFMETLTEQMEK